MSSDSSSSDSSQSDGLSIPFHLMPLAAIFGTYALLSIIHILYNLYKKVTYKPDPKVPVPQPPLVSPVNMLYLSSVILSMLLYAFIVGKVTAIESEFLNPFDPYEILSVPYGCGNTTMIKQSFRSLSKIHHPDKGGDKDTFQIVNAAYKSLTDPASRENWEKFGHPDGRQSPVLDFALPAWLLHPQGTVAFVLVIMYLGLFAGLAWYVFRYVKKGDEKRAQSAREMSVANADLGFLATELKCDMSHLDILCLIAMTPENVFVAEQELGRRKELMDEKKALLKKKGTMLDLDDGGWAEDDDESEEALVAKKAEEDRKSQKEALERSAGSVNVQMFEGVDEGAIGQKWVENVLSKQGKWPPKNVKVIEDMKERNLIWKDLAGELKGDPLQIEAIRRNLTITFGRINSQLLNTHPDLTKAAQAKPSKLDLTYFQSSTKYRQRAGFLLEACLKIASGPDKNSHKLAKTIIEVATLFKIGVFPMDKTNLDWFQGVCMKNYNCVPKMDIAQYDLVTEGEDVIATGDVMTLSLAMSRTHAQNFTQAKIMQAQRQKIPPQMLMSTYREGWWILLRAEKIKDLDIVASSDNDKSGEEEEGEEEYTAANFQRKAMEDFMEFDNEKEEVAPDDILLSAWPCIITNVTQQMGKVKVPVKAPTVPGRYKFYVEIVSMDFIGCDSVITLEKDVFDVEVVKRMEADAEEDEEDGDEEEDSAGEEEEEDKKEK